jgi:hypothetical protein
VVCPLYEIHLAEEPPRRANQSQKEKKCLTSLVGP